jgi:hypothetical protein
MGCTGHEVKPHEQAEAIMIQMKGLVWDNLIVVNSGLVE